VKLVQLHHRLKCVWPQQAAWQVSQKQVGVPSSGEVVRLQEVMAMRA
jgi:hypothetical protein